MTHAELAADKVEHAAKRTLERMEEAARHHPTPRGPDSNRLRDLAALAAAAQADGPEGVRMSIGLEDFALIARSWNGLGKETAG